VWGYIWGYGSQQQQRVSGFCSVDYRVALRLPPRPPFVQSCPSASMVVHGRLAFLTKSSTIHDLLARSAARAAASVDLLRVRAGGTSGGTGRFGGIDALGYRLLACPACHYCGTRLNVPPYQLEFAHEANSYSRCATNAARGSGGQAGRVRAPVLRSKRRNQPVHEITPSPRRTPSRIGYLAFRPLLRGRSCCPLTTRLSV
jgi:hypothetical protein